MTIETIRTPEERFAALSDYPFESHYIEIDGMRMHYLDEGPKDAAPVLMMHGEPTWSYLYRFMIPVCVEAGHRVIAPDLIGFGKSDKPVNRKDYSYFNHVRWITQFIDKTKLDNTTLVCQDWGSLIGLRVAAENESKFKAIVVGNGFLPLGTGSIPFVFKLWRAFSIYSPIFPIGRIVNLGSARKLTERERAAYDAPFPNDKYKAGARIFPSLVPIDETDPAVEKNQEAWEILGQWEKPFLTCFSSGDPIMRGLDKRLQAHVPGAKGMKHQRVSGGHFLQEDSGVAFASAVNELLATI